MSADAELARRAARGDEGAFHTLWGRHRDAVFRFASWMIGERAAAEDVTQETFLALLEFPGRFDAGVGTFRTFLYAIARNVCRKRLKKMRPEEDLDFDGEWLGADSFDRVAGLEEEKAVREAVAALPALQREVVFLFEYEDLSLSETAIAAGADVNTVKARLHRARQRLKKDLSWMKT